MEEISMHSLQREILVLIFDKLPIRSVLACKKVCKEWRCLISDPLFKSNYNIINPSSSTNAPNQPLNLLTPFRRDEDVTIPGMLYEIDASDHTNTTSPLVMSQPLPFPHNFDDFDVTILGCYNGLVALFRFFGQFCLFNPCTGEEKTVFVPLLDDLRWCFFGLCHDPETDEYKVVATRWYIKHLFEHPDLPMAHLLVTVSFKDDVILKLKTISPADGRMKRPYPQPLCDVGTTIQGSPHWISFDTGSILYFDRKTEEHKTTQLPKPAHACGLGALDGQLTVALATETREEGRRCEVWALNNDSWRFLFVLCADRYQHFSLLSWRKDEWVVFMPGEKCLQRELMIYDLKLQRLRPKQLDNKRSASPMNNIVAFFPTLRSPF